MKANKRIDKFLSKYDSLEGKTYIVTGANSGLGFSATKHLVRLGATVIMACRNLDKAKRAKEQILSLYPDAKLTLVPYDQADFQSISTFVERLSGLKVDGLILNAGIYHPKKGLVTKDGFPLTIGTNYIGVYYLLKELSKTSFFKENDHMLLVFVGSLVWCNMKVKNLTKYLLIDKSDATMQYARSKTAIGALSYFLSHHKDNNYIPLPSTIKVHLMHPGVSSTNIVGSSNSSFSETFSRIAHNFLYIFTHHPDVAALGIIEPLLKKDKSEDFITVPRGLFHVSGYPKSKKYLRNLKKDNLKLIEATDQAITHINLKK